MASSCKKKKVDYVKKLVSNVHSKLRQVNKLSKFIKKSLLAICENFSSDLALGIKEQDIDDLGEIFHSKYGIANEDGESNYLFAVGISHKELVFHIDGIGNEERIERYTYYHNDGNFTLNYEEIINVLTSVVSARLIHYRSDE